MNFLLSITENDYATENLLQSFSLGDVMGFGLQMLLIGMATVFAVLCIIWLFLAVFKLVFHDAANRKKNTKIEAVATETVETAPMSVNDDSEIVAVIAAAIAMAESENTDMKFRVVSFRRK